MKLTKKQKILLFQVLVESCKYQGHNFFTLDPGQRLSLSNQILDQQDEGLESSIDSVPCKSKADLLG